MIDGYQSSGESIHLRFGTEIHKALEDFDRAKAQGAGFDEAQRVVIQQLHSRTHDWNVERETRPGKFKNKESLIWTVINYLDHYRADPAETVILDNGKPAVELSFRFDLDIDAGGGQNYMLCGHLDRVVNYSGELYVMDRKTTTSTIASYYFDQYDVSNQMTLYSLGGQITMGSPIRGVIIDAIQILTDSNKFERGFTFRTQDQLEEWLEDLVYLLGVAKGYAEADHWPMNDTACGNYGGCRFREVCSKSPQVRKAYLSNFKTGGEKWNPLKER